VGSTAGKTTAFTALFNQAAFRTHSDENHNILNEQGGKSRPGKVGRSSKARAKN
jgi:hypothetical protein